MPTNILSLRNTKFSLEKTVFGFCVITECKIINPPPPNSTKQYSRDDLGVLSSTCGSEDNTQITLAVTEAKRHNTLAQNVFTHKAVLGKFEMF